MTYFKIYNTPIKIVRPFNIFGPGMYPDDYRVIPNFVSRGLKNEPLIAYDKGQQTRTFCYISDAVSGFLKTLLSNKEGEVFNIGNDADEITMIDLASLVANFITDAKILKKNHPQNYPAENVQRRCPDISKAKKELGYQPRVDLTTGLKRIITWYKAVFPLEIIPDKN